MQLSRRNFLHLLNALGLYALLPGKSLALAQERVYLHRFDPAQTGITAAVKSTLSAVTDLHWLKAGDSVFLKVASNSYFAPPAVTSPAILEGVIQVLKEAGAGIIYVGDMSGAYYVRHLPTRTDGSTRGAMKINGLLAAAESAGAVVHCFEEVPFDSAYVPGIPPGEHHWGDDLHVAEILDRVDHIINLPRLGSHVLAGASLGLKSAVGWISDHSRMVLHRDAETFHQKIAEVNAIPQLAEKMRLTMTLVDYAMTTFGPDHGYTLALDEPLVLASEDVVSHDQVALLVLLWGRTFTPAGEANPYVEQADEFNRSFVQQVWREAAQTLPVFEALDRADVLTHINYAYDLLHGGRPDRIEVLASGLPLDEGLVTLLTARPELHIALA